ncbi:diaminopimelate decarboxylase family protein [Leifsonia soli]|uniref:Diaminopimelate decarboxylase n=1 Tax=Leifsonia soli TaxID=582665 RepID=A0A852SYK4_9MICO|nr:hypothetical protein [Leifsonia soli]NYD74219.1 diaminopimelate decarboxylase [Leifsonia soli]
MTESPPAPPLVDSPTVGLFQSFDDVETPALVYDLENLGRTVQRLRRDLELIPGCGLNVAAKATQCVSLLEQLSGWGLGADVASVGELHLVREAGFSEITATGPSFTSRPAMSVLRRSGVTLDVDSIDQLRFLAADPSHRKEIGLRLRVPVPAQFDSLHSFGDRSRFGVDILDPELHALLATHSFRVTRLHTHTGQLTPASFLFHVSYLLRVAAALPTVATIDFGGGLFDFYADRARARSALREAGARISAWCAAHRRSLSTRFEPGGALLGPHGYLVATVQSVQQRRPVPDRSIVQVDASAWNLAPWHKPHVALADRTRLDAPLVPGVIAGNTLYENDYFGVDTHGRVSDYGVPVCVPGDRLVLTNAGAYTTANQRDFNLLGRVSEYVYDGEGLRRVSGWVNHQGDPP